MLELSVTSAFHVPGRGTVLAGRVLSGTISTGDTVEVRSPSGMVRSVVAGLEVDHTFLHEAGTGTEVAVLLRDFAPERMGDGLTRDEAGVWHVISVSIHGVPTPWWRFW